jgi:triosephosphate isomerase
MKAMIFVNFKTYKEGTGEKALALAGICQEVQKTVKVKIIPVVQVVDLYQIKNRFSDLEIWVQHLDPFPQGQYTGWINLEAIEEAGASGTLLNHSEHKIPPGTIRQIIKRVKALPAQARQESKRAGEFKVLVCCKSLGQAERLAKFKPDFLAYEPPELIGSREKSVASEKPEAIGNLVKMIPDIPIIVGAGIHSQEDVRICLKMSAKGILVATDIVLAKDPKKELLELTEGFKKLP